MGFLHLYIDIHHLHNPMILNATDDLTVMLFHSSIAQSPPNLESTVPAASLFFGGVRILPLPFLKLTCHLKIGGCGWPIFRGYLGFYREWKVL